jgi:catechol 2,3-dioxygenase-like lactoylglutathione lyase family enzyme
MHPILNQISAGFIPVSNIENARDWYCGILGLPADGEILYGHLYILPMSGPNIVLDSKIFAAESVYKVPAFQFGTNDINQAYDFMRANNVQLTTEIENNHWFNFKDPDGNLLMICKC